jgi:regulator of protease activity HflC (stomatin/prohibitin superfamily)
MSSIISEVEFTPLVISVAVIVIVLIIARYSIRIVRPFEKGVVERLGRFQRLLDPGLSIIVPFVDKIRKVDMREIVLDVLPQEVITEDNVVVTVDALIYYSVMDPHRVLYNVENFRDAATKLAQTNLRNVIGSLTLDKSLTSREMINAQLREVLDAATDAWGVRVGRVEIKRIDPPKDVTEAMHRQMSAERSRRALVLESDGKREAAILVAEGNKKSAILQAEGQAEAIMKVAEAKKREEILLAEGNAQAIENVFNSIHIGNPTNDLLTYQYLQTLQKMADGKASKIVIPYELSGIMGLVTALADATKDSKSSSKEKTSEQSSEGSNEGK